MKHFYPFIARCEVVIDHLHVSECSPLSVQKLALLNSRCRCILLAQMIALIEYGG